jgi:AraC-like DNA-binding protein
LVIQTRAGAMAHFADVARQVGIDPFRALRRAGIDQRALNDPEMRLPFAVVNGLFEDAAAESGCPTFGLRMGEMRRLSDAGPLSLLFAHQPTLRESVRVATTYVRMLNEAVSIEVEEAGDLVVVREIITVDDPRPTTQSYELLVTIRFRVFRTLLGPQWRPLSVHFTHDAPADLTVHRRVFGPDVHFRSEFNGLVLGAADFDKSAPTADPTLARYAEQVVQTLPNPSQDDDLLRVRKAVHQLLPDGKASLAQAALKTGLNERTLQRRLAAEGVPFSNLVNDVRRELAERYLADPGLSVTEVARLLGYSQISSFTRWFIGEFGASPVQWRRDRTSGPG